MGCGNSANRPLRAPRRQTAARPRAAEATRATRPASARLESRVWVCGSEAVWLTDRAAGRWCGQWVVTSRGKREASVLLHTQTHRSQHIKYTGLEDKSTAGRGSRVQPLTRGPEADETNQDHMTVTLPHRV